MNKMTKNQALLRVPERADNVPQAALAAPGVTRVGDAFNAT
jgi:hypothetical protein